MDLFFVCSWVVTGLCFASPWDASKCAFSGAAAAQCQCHNSIPASVRSCSSTTHGCTGLSLQDEDTHPSSTVAEVLKGSKCAERILRVKRIQKHLQRNGSSRAEQSWLGSMDSPGETVKCSFWSIHLLMLLQLLQGLNIIELVLLQLL